MDMVPILSDRGGLLCWDGLPLCFSAVDRPRARFKYAGPNLYSKLLTYWRARGHQFSDPRGGLMKSSPEAEAQNMKPSPKAATKKPYIKPVLKVFGDIQALTEAVSSTSGKADGGTGTMAKNQ